MEIMNRGANFSNGPTGGNSGNSIYNGPGYVYLKYVLTPEVLESRVTFWDFI